MARTPLDRTRVITAARDVITRDGLDRFSMRALSAELGVEAPSLYGHVKDKAEILDGLAELVYGEMTVPPSGDNWTVRVRMYADAFRRALLRHPNLAPVVAVRPVMSVATIGFVENALAELVALGLTGHQAQYTLDTMASFVIGNVLFELSTRNQAIGGHDPEALAAARTALPADRYPNVARTLAVPVDSTVEFNFGLSLIIDGLRPYITKGLQGERPQPPPVER